MAIRKPGARGGGGGNASIGVLLRQAGEDDRGLFIAHRSGDLTWHAQAEARTAEEAEVRARIRVLGRDNANHLDWILPSEANWPAIPPEQANLMAIAWSDRDGKARGRIPFTGGPGDTDESYLDVVYPVEGTGGNDRYINVYRRPATQPGAGASATISGAFATRDGAQNGEWIRFAADTVGLGDDYRVRFVEGNDHLRGNSWDPAARVLTLAIPAAGTVRIAGITNSIIGRFNNASGSPPITVATQGDARTNAGNATIEASDYVGQTFDFSGAALPRGAPKIVDGDIKGAADSPALINIFATRAVDASGVSDISRQFVLQYSSQRADGTAALGPQGAHLIIVSIHGTVTLQDIVDLINGRAASGGVTYRASLGTGMTGSETVTVGRSSENVNIHVSHGAANNDTPLEATFEAGDLNVFALPGDSLTDIEDAIEALDEFGAPDVTGAPTSVNTDTITGLGDHGASLAAPAMRIAFAGGAAVPQLGFNRAGFSFFFNDGVTTLTALRDIIVGQTYGEPVSGRDGPDQAIPAGDVVITGDGSDLVQASSLPSNPTGGRNHVPAGLVECIARPNDQTDGPNILLKYDPDAEDMAAVKAGFEANNSGGFSFSLVYGTDPDAAPEEPPFVRSFYDGGLAEAPTTGTGGITEGQAEGIVRRMAKGAALKGGPAWPDTEIDPDIARDGEVPGLLAEALTTRAPNGSQNDEVPFLTAGGNWSKATTQVLRQLFKGYVGTWPVAAGFIYRKGDITDHDGRVYFVNTEHPVDTGDGPETNAKYTPLDNWVGAIAQGWYRAGSIGLYQGGLYAAISDVVNTDALPGVDHPKWLLISQDSRAILDGGTYRPASTFKKNRIVRKPDAAYLTLRDVPAGIDPGVANNWETYYYRLGWVDGAPGSLVGAPVFNEGTGELVTGSRGGTEYRTPIPAGGTAVEANPSGTDGEEMDRINIGGRNYNLPHGFRPQLIGSGDFGNPADTNFVLPTSGGIQKPATIADGEWWGFASSVASLYGSEIYIFPASALASRSREAGQSGGANNSAVISVSHNRGCYLAFNAAGQLVAAKENNNDNLGEISLFRVGYGDNPAAAPNPPVNPTVTSFALTSGEQHPVAGALAAKVYGVEWAIAQSDHVGLARIVGFKGDFGDGSGATILSTIPAGNYAHGSGNLLIPNGVSLAADETYRLRIQVFGEGVTNPAIGATPASSQDIVITAHAAATANYHWGRLPYVANKTAAQYAADIVFANTDLVTGAALDTTNGYRATPDTTGTWVFYLAAKDGETQPASWVDHNGLPASSAFEDVVDQGIGGVDFAVYVMSIQRTNADGSQTYIPRA